jgi:LPPG:FO 2-phospho-L-lactate transferase
MSRHVVALSGGVGGAKLAQGLALALAPQELTVIVNTGDDFRHLGLHICPDLDSVMYALAGLSDAARGWGRRDETWTFMQALAGLGGESWFQLGDADLAVHVERSWRLAQGWTLSRVTAHLCERLGVTARVLPMSDDPVHTRVLTPEGWLDFQDYFVRRQCQPVVRAFEFSGAAAARPQPEALAALSRTDLRAIVICPSNPFVSVEPILAVPGLRAALQESAAPVIAVTPIIGGRAVKGPAAKMLTELGLAASAAAVAHRYAGLAAGFVLDASDPEPEPVAEMQYFRAPTLMLSEADRVRLAHEVLRAADALRAASGVKYSPRPHAAAARRNND